MDEHAGSADWRRCQAPVCSDNWKTSDDDCNIWLEGWKWIVLAFVQVPNASRSNSGHGRMIILLVVFNLFLYKKKVIQSSSSFGLISCVNAPVLLGILCANQNFVRSSGSQKHFFPLSLVNVIYWLKGAHSCHPTDTFSSAVDNSHWLSAEINHFRKGATVEEES